MLQQIDEIQGIGLHLDLVLRKVQEAYLRTFRSLNLEMTIEQWVILHQVHELGVYASQREIVQTNFRNRATISRVIGGLERKGWLKKTRFEGDQKRFKLELTSKGQEIIDMVLTYAITLRKQTVKNLDMEEFHTFLKVLNQIGSNYETYS
ncbi:MAG: MarR family winged helix-turn-helix transcriptional regulator [Croceivirga sp.]